MKRLTKAPSGIAIFLLVGPSIVWASEYIGSGEVILATRVGAILGTTVIWAVIAGIVLKFWIGMSGARYTVATGEGMIDMIARTSGPSKWGVWVVLIAQFLTAAVAIGSLASAAGIFISNIFGISREAGGWIVTIFALAVSWSGKFNILRILMSILVMITLLGVIWVAVTVFPGGNQIVKGLLFTVPEVPSWAIQQGVGENAWKEILPLIGWGAGGFASQVWYTYWVIGAGYGMAKKEGYGKPADTTALKKIGKDEARQLKGWFKVVYTDASMAVIIGIIATLGFLFAGAGILNPLKLAPESENLASDLSNVFASRWGETGALLFMTGGLAALISTQVGQLAGWPRLLADSFRICIPSVSHFTWKTQYRVILLFFFISNMTIIYSLGYKPVFLVKSSAILDGLLLTPLQAMWVFIGLYFVQPRLFNRESGKILKPGWIFGAGLILAFIVFAYFCLYQIPKIL